MLNIEYYEDEIKILSGYYGCCAYIDVYEFDGYTSLEQIECRCATYEDAKRELLEHIIKLRNALNDLIEREMA